MAGNSAPRLGLVIFGLLALAYCSSRESPRVVPVATPAAPAGGVQPASISRSSPPAAPRAPARLAAVPPLPALTDPAPAWTAVMYTTARVNLRAAPSMSAQVLLRLEAGASVTVSGSEGRWWRAAAGGQHGWAHADYLTASAPPAAAPPREPSARSVAPAASLATPRLSGHRPIREAYVGTCDCPYDYKRNGARCGATSAYSRPGGREPECYE